MGLKDYNRRFLFEGEQVRGQRVRLDATLKEVFARRSYPPSIANELAQALVATALLSSTVKFDGRLTLQVRGSQTLSLLVAQALPEGGLRGIAKWGETDLPLAASGNAAALYGDAQLVIAIAPERDGQPYQGVVPMQPRGLAASIEYYFAQSEQLETRLWLQADSAEASGLLLQRLPDADPDDPFWQEVVAATEAGTPETLSNLSDEHFLKRLYGDHTLRLFRPQPLSFECGCSAERTAGMIKALGRDEGEAILEEQGELAVTCEFCGAEYVFDAVDVNQIHTAGMWTPTGRRPQ